MRVFTVYYLPVCVTLQIGVKTGQARTEKNAFPGKSEHNNNSSVTCQ